jgi:hypothetical protein
MAMADRLVSRSGWGRSTTWRIPPSPAILLSPAAPGDETWLLAARIDAVGATALAVAAIAVALQLRHLLANDALPAIAEAAEPSQGMRQS